MDTFLQRSPRNLGTLRSSGLNRQAFGGTPKLDQAPLDEPAVNTYTPAAPRPASPVARARPDLGSLDQYQPGSFGAVNQAANVGLYAPGSFGDQNAQANGTGYAPSPGTSVTGIKAPAQTERANPLSGDNNIPSESATTSLPPPFVQRGSGVPRGQDSMAPVKMTQTMDADIGTSMQGTQDRLRGTTPLYRPQFQQQQQPQRQKSYEDYRRSIFG